MARNRLRIPSLVALSAALALVTGCGGDGDPRRRRAATRGRARKGKPWWS